MRLLFLSQTDILRVACGGGYLGDIFAKYATPCKLFETYFVVF